MRTKKEISPEDQEILLALNILKNIQEELKMTIQEAVDAVTAVKVSVSEVKAGQTADFAKVLGAINRLEAKIATGANAQPIVDALAGIKQDVADMAAAQVTHGAEMDITGV